MQWTVVIPVKALPGAKSRLTSRGADAREQLALAFARDTVDAVLATDGIDEVFAVTSDPHVGNVLTAGGIVVVDEPGSSSLNAALVLGAGVARSRRPRHGVLALCADLPALRPADLAEALLLAEAYVRCFVADTTGDGTTCLAAAPGHALDPRFGIGSAGSHARSGATALPGDLRSLRMDVDSPEDLAAAVDLGVGPWTAAALAVV